MAIIHTKIQEHAQSITQARAVEHGDSWLELEPNSLLYAAFYKVDRAIHNRTNKSKKLDDIVDAYNYLAAYYQREKT